MAFLLLASLFVAAHAAYKLPEGYIFKRIMDSGDFVITYGVEFLTEEDRTQVDTVNLCYRSCKKPDCLAFRYDNVTKDCIRAKCSEIKPAAGQPMTLLRALDGTYSNSTTNESVMANILSADTNCVQLAIWYNTDGIASNLFRQPTNEGYQFFSSSVAAEAPLPAVHSEIIGQMIKATVGDKTALETVKKNCPDTSCLAVLCRPSVPGNFLFPMADLNGLCMNQGGDKSARTIGLVAAQAGCCGANLPIYEYTKESTQRTAPWTASKTLYAYGNGSVPVDDYKKKKMPLFHIWENAPQKPSDTHEEF